jgi:hypothetical protein
MVFPSMISPLYIKQLLASLLAMEIVQLSKLFIKVQWLSSLAVSISNGIVCAATWVDDKLSISARLNNFSSRVNGYIENTENNWFGRKGLQFCRFLCRTVKTICKLLLKTLELAANILANPTGARIAFVLSSLLLFLAPISPVTAGICVAIACTSSVGGHLTKYFNDRYVTGFEAGNEDMLRQHNLQNSDTIKELKAKEYTPTWGDRIYEAAKLNFIEATGAIAISLILGNWWMALISVPSILFNNNGSVLSLDEVIIKFKRAEDVKDTIDTAVNPNLPRHKIVVEIEMAQLKQQSNKALGNVALQQGNDVGQKPTNDSVIAVRVQGGMLNVTPVMPSFSG